MFLAHICKEITNILNDLWKMLLPPRWVLFVLKAAVIACKLSPLLYLCRGLEPANKAVLPAERVEFGLLGTQLV